MLFPYDQYQLLLTPLKVHYPAGEETLARWVTQTINSAGKLVSQLLGQKPPQIEILLVAPGDWHLAPHEDEEEISNPHPYLTNATTPPSIVVPTEIDEIFGELTQEKLAFILYHELALAFLEHDPRPWPEENPLWADEWQFALIALWLSHQLDGVQGVVNKDLHAQYAEIFEPEPDGKTPVTVRGFDWYEDTTPEDYLIFELLLEQFAADLLDQYDIGILPRFLSQFRQEHQALLSDDVTAMLGAALGSGGEEWLESLVYF